MSLGATMSAPARAWETAVRASSSTLESLSTVPCGVIRPQWPWSVYSHRHTSVITSSSGSASLIARVAICTMPSSSHAPEPSPSLWSGMPNSRTAGMPACSSSPASSTSAEIDSRSTPGIASIGCATIEAGLDEQRRHEVARMQARFADEVAQDRGRAQSPQARLRECHRFSLAPLWRRGERSQDACHPAAKRVLLAGGAVHRGARVSGAPARSALAAAATATDRHRRPPHEQT